MTAAARLTVVSALLAGVGCGSDEAPGAPEPDRSASDRAVQDVKAYVTEHVAALSAACEAICAAAPEPDGDGWTAADDAGAVRTMRDRWRAARIEYERVEGAIAVLFPQLDLDVDGRYEHVAELESDPDPFDAHGFVGMHAVERILWADAHPPEVRRFERALHGYVEARTPGDAAEAREFREGLCARLARDVATMRAQLEPLALDPQTAFRGIQGSIEEQAEKVLLGATGQDESRYAQNTLADMLANLEGGRAVLAAYEPMMREAPEAGALLPAIERRLSELERAYTEIGTDALPEVPEGFNPDTPEEAHLETPYGRLFSLLSHESDPRAEGSLAQLLRRSGQAMGIPPLAR